MIGNLPDSTAQSIGGRIAHTFDLLTIISVLCVVTAGICFVLAMRSTGRRAKVFRGLAMLLAIATFGPPLFVIFTVGY